MNISCLNQSTCLRPPGLETVSLAAEYPLALPFTLSLWPKGGKSGSSLTYLLQGCNSGSARGCTCTRCGQGDRGRSAAMSCGGCHVVSADGPVCRNWPAHSAQLG